MGSSSGVGEMGGIKDSNRSPAMRMVWKWTGFVTALWVQAIAGNNYTFANYSSDLKAVMNYNQVQLNTLSVAKDVGKSFGLVAGFCADLLPTWAILLIGSFVGVVGYGVQWLVVSQRIAPPPMWQMALAMCLGGNSTTWMNTACLVTCLRNFAGSRGTVSGIMKGYIGLSTAIFTVLCSSLFTGNSSAFLLLLTLLPVGINGIAMIFMRQVSPVTTSKEDVLERTGFNIVNVIAGVLSLYLLLYSISADLIDSRPLLRNAYATVLVIFLMMPLVVPARLLVLEYIRGSSLRSKTSESVDVNRAPLIADAQVNDPGQEVERGASVAPAIDVEYPLLADSTGVVVIESDRADRETVRLNLGDEHTALEAVKTFDFWVLFFTFLCGVGTGITVLNNLGQIGESLGYANVAIFVTFTSIFGFFGRIAAGAISEHFVRTSALPRPLWMGLSKLLMMVGYIYLAAAAPGALSVGSIIVGLCYGVHITISVPTVSEMFGLGSFGLMYNILVLNIPLGSFLFSGLLAGFLYDREAAKDVPASGPAWGRLLSNWLHEQDAPNKCFGGHCFRILFLILAVVSGLGLTLDIILTFRLRPLYQTIRRRRQHSLRLKL